MANQDPEPDKYARDIELCDPLRQAAMQAAVEALDLPPGSRGLDAGCGIGSHMALLAEAVAPGGHVTGVDVSDDLLARARANADMSGLANRMVLQQGDVGNLPFPDRTFDWAWSVDCVGFLAVERPDLVGELVRVVKPGGTVAILVWSSQQLLPGYPLLEARLNTTCAGTAPFRAGMKPERHFLRTLGWLRDAGLEDISARTFAADVHAPLSDDMREAVISLFEMRWGEPESELSSAEWDEYKQVCRSASPDFIVDSPDYYAFFTYSLFHGKVLR